MQGTVHCISHSIRSACEKMFRSHGLWLLLPTAGLLTFFVPLVGGAALQLGFWTWLLAASHFLTLSSHTFSVQGLHDRPIHSAMLLTAVLLDMRILWCLFHMMSKRYHKIYMNNSEA